MVRIICPLDITTIGVRTVVVVPVVLVVRIRGKSNVPLRLISLSDIKVERSFDMF